MKKYFFLALFILPFIINAQNLNGRFSSSFYTFERFDTKNNSETYIRNYEGLSLNFNYDKFSVNSRLGFETNIGNSLSADPRMRFYNLYLEAREILDLVTLKVGRQPLFNSVAGGLYDGVNLKVKYDDFAISGFYGGNVPAYQKLELTDDFANDNVMGASFEGFFLDHFKLGLNYIDKNFKPVNFFAERIDVNSNLTNLLIEQKSNQFKYLSGDLSYFDEIFTVDTRYEYDLNYEVTSKVEATGRVQASKKFGVELYYNWREPRINYNSIFSVFNFGNSQEFEGGFDFKIDENLTLVQKFAYVEYNDEASQRITIGLNTSWGNISYRKNLGYAGELDGISIYTAKSFADGFITPSVGLSYSTYKLSKDSEQNSIAALLAGVNVRPWKQFSFDLQTQYFNNKIYKNDLRVLLKINHWFNINF